MNALDIVWCNILKKNMITPILVSVVIFFLSVSHFVSVRQRKKKTQKTIYISTTDLQPILLVVFLQDGRRWICGR